MSLGQALCSVNLSTEDMDILPAFYLLPGKAQAVAAHLFLTELIVSRRQTRHVFRVPAQKGTRKEW